jgi:hypothetical protein
MINPRSFLKLCLLACLLATLSACQQVPLPQTAQAGPHTPEPALESKAAPQTSETYGPPTKLGSLADPAINESSGIVASRTTPGLYWTHNDSGDGPFIYAFDNRGASRGVWLVTGAASRDWEDIAAGPGPVRGKNYLYIGDIGDNSGNRADVVIYRVSEPAIKADDAQSTKRNPRATEAAEAIRLRYPDGAHDAEALMVHPVTGNIYIITKIPFADPSIYEADAPQKTDRTTTLVRVGKLNVPSLLGGIITGGDISPDGRRVALCDYLQGYEIVLPDARGAFNQIWKQPLKTIALGARNQGEAIAYRLDGRALLTTSEGLHSPLNQVVRR